MIYVFSVLYFSVSNVSSSKLHISGQVQLAYLRIQENYLWIENARLFQKCGKNLIKIVGNADVSSPPVIHIFVKTFQVRFQSVFCIVCFFIANTETKIYLCKHSVIKVMISQSLHFTLDCLCLHTPLPPLVIRVIHNLLYLLC